MTTPSVLHKPGDTAWVAVRRKPEWRGEDSVHPADILDMLQRLQAGSWVVLSTEWHDELPRDMGSGWLTTARYDG